MKRAVSRCIGMMVQYKHLRREYSKTLIDETLSNELIIFNSIKSDESVFGVEFLILLMLSRKGAKCIGVIDDNIFSHHDFIQKSDGLAYINPQERLAYVLRRKLLTWLLRRVSKKIQLVYASELIDTLWDENDQQVIDALCIKHAKSSTKRYFQAGFYDENSEDHKNYYDLSYKNCVLSIRVACFSIKMGATKFITSHGIYSCWGPAYDYLTYKGFSELFVYGINTYKSGEMFVSKKKLQLQSECEYVKESLLLDLTAEEEKQAVKYLEDRVNKKTKDNRVYYNFELKAVSLDKSKRNIFLFPNVIWDGDIPEKDTLFDGTIEWILESIKFAKETPEVNLYIRFHPAETSWYDNCEKLEDIVIPLAENMAADNIFFIKSAENIDLYNVIPEIDLLVVYDGILALESAYLKRPFVLAATGRFSVEGCGGIPRDKGEYFEMLLSYTPDEAELEAIKLLGIRFAYIYNFGIVVPLASISNESTDFGVDLTQCTSINIDLENNLKLKKMLGIL